MATFDSISNGAHYWTGALPPEGSLAHEYVRDGAWMNLGPVRYQDIAHVIVPRFFFEEALNGRQMTEWTHRQDIEGLSDALTEADVDHALSPYALELKLF